MTIEEMAKKYARNEYPDEFGEAGEIYFDMSSQRELAIDDYTKGANAVLEEIEFTMRLGSADHVSLAAVKECIKNLKGGGK